MAGIAAQAPFVSWSPLFSWLFSPIASWREPSHSILAPAPLCSKRGRQTWNVLVILWSRTRDLCTPGQETIPGSVFFLISCLFPRIFLSGIPSPCCPLKRDCASVQLTEQWLYCARSLALIIVWQRHCIQESYAFTTWGDFLIASGPLAWGWQDMEASQSYKVPTNGF